MSRLLDENAIPLIRAVALVLHYERFRFEAIMKAKNLWELADAMDVPGDITIHGTEAYLQKKYQKHNA